jgi:hypothetical protein
MGLASPRFGIVAYIGGAKLGGNYYTKTWKI